MFDLKTEPQTYEEMIKRAKLVNARLGIAPKPATFIRPAPSAPRPYDGKLRQERRVERRVKNGKVEGRYVAATKEFLTKRLPAKTVSVDVVWDYWHESLKLLDAAKPPRAQQAISLTARAFNIPKVLLFSRVKVRAVHQPRWALWELLRNRQYTYCQIARFFDVDHSTVVYGVQRSKQLKLLQKVWIEEDRQYGND